MTFVNRPLLTTLDQPFPPVEEGKGYEGFLVRTTLNFFENNKLKEAYAQGIFPWFVDEFNFINWFAPTPRMVLFPEEVVVSHSMKTLLNKNKYKVTFNQAYKSVLRGCALTPRKEGPGTWLDRYFFESNVRLFEEGLSESVEVWNEQNVLVGGLYATKLNKVYFGESMFSLEPNMSKLALILWCKKLVEEGAHLIDCQMSSSHLISMGAREISIQKLQQYIQTH